MTARPGHLALFSSMASGENNGRPHSRRRKPAIRGPEG